MEESHPKPQAIEIEEASEHNLKGISLKVPYDQITCFTGISGSGKSSLVYDLVFSEAQRRYFSTYSGYARQFLNKLQPGHAKSVKGLLPAIAIKQRKPNFGSRSTMGTLSELYDHLRLLFARTGHTTLPITLSRSLFSFNTAKGACPSCKGLGVEDKIDPELLIADANKSLREGALKITTPSGYTIYSQVTIEVMEKVCQSEGFSVDIPWKDLTEQQKYIVLYGSDKIKIPYGKHSLESRMKWTGIKAQPREEGYYKGILPVMEHILKVDRNPNILRFAKTQSCSACQGARLNPEALSVTIDNYSIAQLAAMPLTKLMATMPNLTFQSLTERKIAAPVIASIQQRCEQLIELGLGYLTLERNANTLAGGEVQRILLSTQLGNQLGGMLYLLDEPAMGLHARDKHAIMQLMRKLQKQGNTVWLVEHDEQTIKSADYLVDLGPRAGKYGGELCWHGYTPDILESPEQLPQSPTLNLLAQKYEPVILSSPTSKRRLTASGLKRHNLKDLQIGILRNGLNVVCGVSGVGKTTLLHELAQLPQALEAEIEQVMTIDATPIGRTPRSNPATYTKVYDKIRKLFAARPKAQEKGFKASHFSFNNKGGRCETCQGAGVIQTGMHFMGTLETVCETCNGQRFRPEILSVTYKGKHIAQVLDMEIDDAVHFFQEDTYISKQLQVFKQLGLGYLTLGQSATTLSGGEAQRLKLVSFLVKASRKHTLFLFDEPATGLHEHDVRTLLQAIDNLLKSGHTVVMAEHQRTLIEAAHHLIELGPEGGEAGGYCLFAGTPHELKQRDNTPTAKWLWHTDIKKNEAPESAFPEHIELKGIKTHNLQDLSIKIPHQKLTVITGVSGSGKSSLAFDTLFAEGQRNFTSHFSAYARTLIARMERPDLERASGMTPPIAISSHSITRNPRATTGTISGIWDPLRLLFSRIANEQKGDNSLTSSHFSFNHQAGMCPDCQGLGMRMQPAPAAFMSDSTKPLMDGAMKGHKLLKALTDPYSQEMAIVKTVASINNWDLSKPWKDLAKKTQQSIFYGTGNKSYAVTWHFKRKTRQGTHEFESPWYGLVHYVKEAYEAKLANGKEREILGIMQEVPCQSCEGTRLKARSRLLTIGQWRVQEIAHTEIQQLNERLKSMAPHLPEMGKKLLEEVLKEIAPKIQGLKDLGLGYLTLNRDSRTLSGGEGRRLRLVSQLGGELQRITYILDEPTIGLHPSDINGLIKWLKDLARNNTVVVVEHDTEVMAAADHLIELGPGSGVQGGKLLFAGSFKELRNAKASVTSAYLDNTFAYPEISATPSEGLTIRGANANNLKDVNLSLIRNGLCVFQGVSGSGKSSLLQEVIYASAKAKRPVACQRIDGLAHFHQVLLLDQQPLASSKNSLPLTYLGIFDEIRKAFAEQETAKAAGLKSKHFSLYTKGGRCETCKGEGAIKTAMDFLADVWVPCPDCNGKRFREEILQTKVHDLTIVDVLNASIAELKGVWADESIASAFELLSNLGLSHLKAGQSLRTLSGGEAQRLKLAKVLLQKHQKPTLFLLDEPTTGLHLKDIEQLVIIFAEVIAQGHTLYITEHHPVIAQLAHQIVELGPEGGEKGGHLM